MRYPTQGWRYRGASDRDLRRETKRVEAAAKRALEGAPARPRKARKPKERAPRPPRDRSALPDRVTVRIDPPPGYSYLGQGTRARFARLTEEAVVLIHRERELLGQTRFLGIKAVLLQDPRESAGDTFPTFARNPRIACSGVVPRRDALLELQAWRLEVEREARGLGGGDRNVVFLAGVYGLWRFHGALVVGTRPRAQVSPAPERVATPVTRARRRGHVRADLACAHFALGRRVIRYPCSHDPACRLGRECVRRPRW